jgi:hypothetical protein
VRERRLATPADRAGLDGMVRAGEEDSRRPEAGPTQEPLMSRKDRRITAYVAAAPPFARPILKEIRAAMHAGCPEVEETVKWGMPSFVRHGLLGGMAAFKAHVSLWLWRGRHLPSLGAGKRGAMGQFGRLAKLSDLPPRARLVRLVKEAAALDEALAAHPAARKKFGPGRFPKGGAGRRSAPGAVRARKGARPGGLTR